MRAQIYLCLAELVKSKFGDDKWNAILKASGLDSRDKYMRYFNGFDILDAKFLEIVKNLCMILNLSQEQASDAFGEYWIAEYASKIYGDYYSEHRDIRSFIKGLDGIHAQITDSSPGMMEPARPPRFDITVIDENTWQVHYKSKRMLIDFYTGLIRGIGKYFNTPLEVIKLSEEEVRIVFL
jgi:hypothetical protein